MKAAAIVVVAAAIALGAQGFTFEIEIAGPAASKYSLIHFYKRLFS